MKPELWGTELAYDAEQHHRRSIRLHHYNYACAGAYFVTLCAYGRRCLFGEIVAGKMCCNALGDIVSRRWLDIPRHFPHVRLDACVLMPNHLHGVLMIPFDAAPGPLGDAWPAPVAARHTARLGVIIRSFKAAATRDARGMALNAEGPLWQRNYYEHIVRGPKSLDRIRQYIIDNPAQWQFDRENPANFR